MSLRRLGVLSLFVSLVTRPHVCIVRRRLPSAHRFPFPCSPLPQTIASMHRHLFCFLGFLVLSFLVPLITAQSSPSVSNLTILSASGDGTCVNTGGLALNCSFPFTLTLQVQYLTLPVPAYTIYIRASNVYVSYFDPANNNATSTSIEFTINSDPMSFAPTINSVSITDQRNSSNVVRWPATPAFAPAPYPLPVVASVTGCAGNPAPLVTTGCYPDVDTLTLIGAGFLSMGYFSIVTNAYIPEGGQRSACCFTTASSGITVYNDTVMTLTLADSFGFLFIAEHFIGIPVSIWFRWNNGYSTDKFNITMALLPAPVILSYYAPGVAAVQVNNVTTYPQCLPGVSQFSITGQWLYNGTLTIGPTQCNTALYGGSTGSRVTCNLPVIEPVVNGTMYNVVFSNPVGNVTLPNVIGFTLAPVLNGIVSCWSDGGRYTFNGNPLARCSAGQTLYIYGRGFVAGGYSLLNVTFDSPTQQTTVQCINPAVANDTSLYCTLPAVGNNTWLIGQSLSIQTLWSSGYASNRLGWYIYDYLNAPRIYSVIGCNQTSTLASGLSLTNCAQGDRLTLTGINFNFTTVSQWMIVSGTPYSSWSGSWYCTYITLLSNTTLTCELPTAAEFPYIDWTVPYSVVLTPTTYSLGYGVSSNQFFVTFATPAGSSSSSSSSAMPPPPRSVSSSSSAGSINGGSESSSSASTAVKAAVSTVLTVVVVLAIAVAVWWCWRSRAKARSGSSVDEDSSTFSPWRSWHPMSGTSRTGELEMGDVDQRYTS